MKIRTVKVGISTNETEREIVAIQDNLLSTMDYISELMQELYFASYDNHMAVYRGGK